MGYAISIFNVLLLCINVVFGISEKANATSDLDYSIVQIDGASLNVPTPQLPDVSIYKEEWIKQKIPASSKSIVSVIPMHKELSLHKFLQKEKMHEWVERQGKLPQIIKIESGVITIPELFDELKDEMLMAREGNVYTLRVPLVIGKRANLVVSGDEVASMRMSEGRGSFIVNNGHVYFYGTQLVGWNESQGTPSYYKNKDEFRPFFLAWNASKSYFFETVVKSLGYAASKSYGLSISHNIKLNDQGFSGVHPTAWIVDSTFVDMYFGFYSYEADDVVLLRNVYEDNIVYGIDPHDRSTNFIIAFNEAYGTKEKHGIIISREVNDSWVFNNFSHDNHGSGFMIDRNSVRNVFANNLSLGNGGDGYAVYESPNNLLWNNKALSNGRHGVQVRNSTAIKVYNNTLADNGKYGVFGHIKTDFSGSRDLELDPFIADVSITVSGSRVYSNKKGAISIDSPYKINLYDLDLRYPYKQKGTYFRGVLSHFHNKIFDIIYRQKGAVAVVPHDISH